MRAALLAISTVAILGVAGAARAADPPAAARPADSPAARAPAAAAPRSAAAAAAASKAGAEAAQKAAPEAPPQQPAVADNKPEIQRFENWEVRCFPAKSASPCDLLYFTVRKGTEQRATSFDIAYIPSKGQYVMQIAVPYGVSLPDGLVIAAGNFRSGKFPFRRCDGTGCFVELTIGDDLITALKAGGAGSLNVVADRSKPIAFELPLKDFPAAYQSMVELATQKAVAPAPAAPTPGAR